MTAKAEDLLEPVYLFGIASRHAHWASVRQATVTGNIANANTPGYLARDIEPFETVLDKTRLVLARTSASHLDISGVEAGSSRAAATDAWEVSHSGNSVSLDQELLRAGDTNRAFTLTNNIVRAFHRMTLASTRSA